jgi:hypothetical protein
MDAKIEIWERVVEGVTDENIGIALGKLERSEDSWPPGPGAFLALCQPTAKELGHMPVEDAYRLAAGAGAKGAILPAIVWHAQQQVGPHELRTRPERDMFPKFKTVYERMTAHERAGGETFVFPEPLDTSHRLERPPRGKAAITPSGRDGLAAARRALHESHSPEQCRSSRLDDMAARNWVSTAELAHYFGQPEDKMLDLLAALEFLGGADGSALTNIGKRYARIDGDNVQWDQDAVEALMAAAWPAVGLSECAQIVQEEQARKNQGPVNTTWTMIGAFQYTARRSDGNS